MNERLIMRKILERTISLLLIGLSGSVLLIWPFAALASVMGLGGHVSENTPSITLYFAYSFHLGVILYPAVFIFSAVITFSRFSSNNTKYIVLFSAIPILYLSVLVLLAMIGMK